MGCQGIEGIGGGSRPGGGGGRSWGAGGAQGAEGTGGPGGGGQGQGGGRDAGTMRDQHMPGMMKDWSRGMSGGEGAAGSGGGGATGSGGGGATGSGGGGATGSGGGGATAAGGGGSAAPAGSSKPPASGSSGGASGNALIDEINRVRAENGLPPLTADATLSAESAQNDEANIASGAAGNHHFNFGTAEVTEGPGSLDQTPQQVVQRWLDSPEHRDIILGNYTTIGADMNGGYATADLK